MLMWGGNRVITKSPDHGILPTATRQFKTVPLPEIIMSQNPTESKYLLSHVIAEWACALKYKDLSPAAIQAAKLFWFDSIGCALGGSQQDDAKILLKHYRAMSAMADSSGGERGGKGNATAFVSGFKTNPVDAAFLNGHMIRAMDYNDIYWKADPCHPSDLIAAPLALCESEGLSGRDLILATIIAYEIEMRFCEIGRPGVREYGWHHATLSAFAAPVAAARALNLTSDQMVSARPEERRVGNHPSAGLNLRSQIK